MNDMPLDPSQRVSQVQMRTPSLAPSYAPSLVQPPLDRACTSPCNVPSGAPRLNL